MAAATLLATFEAATPSAFAAGSSGSGSGSSSGSATFSVGVVPQIYAITVSQSISAFSNCSGGDSTATSLGFPNGLCDVGSGSTTSGFTPAVTITNTGIASDVDVNGANATPSDGGTPWTLCTDNVTGSTLCGTTNGDAPGANQYSLFTAAYNERAGIPNVTNSPACDNLFDVTSNSATGGCTATTGEVGKEGLELEGPASSTDMSSAFSIPVTWTAVPPPAP